MALLATQERFEGGPGAWYDRYQRYPFFARRAAWIHQSMPPGKVLVAGCGWGFLVDELLKLGRDVWGIDASGYCVTKSSTELPLASALRVSQRSALVRADLNASRSAAGLAGNSRFDVGVTEDLLPCVEVPEVSTLVGEMRRACAAMLHIVTPGDGTAQPPGRVAEMQWRTPEDWKGNVKPDLVMDAETWAVL